MSGSETTTKFKLDITELKKGMQDAQRAIKLANAEFKASSSVMSDWERSADGLSAKNKQLSQTLEAQKQKLSILTSAYKEVANEQGENSVGAQELLIKINNQKAEIGKTQTALEKYGKRLEDCKNSTGDFAKESEKVATSSEKLKQKIELQEQELQDLKKQYTDTALEQGKTSAEAKTLARQIEKLSKELDGNKTSLSSAEDQADKFDKSLKDMDEGAKKASEGFTIMKGALANLVADGIRRSIDAVKDLCVNTITAGVSFETTFAGVRKTVDATEQEFRKLEKASMDMSEKKPVDADDINKIMELGGQLGIAKDNLIDFSATVADMDVSTDLGAEDAATEMAQFANITKMSQTEMSNMGSTVVDLGNKTATTESKIMDMAMRIAGAGSQVGLTNPQILGMAASLSSVGIEAEAGGSAISTIMSTIDKEVATNGESLEVWASTAGMTADTFKEKWKNDVAGAMQDVFKGMSDAKEGGENLNVVLGDMGVESIRQTDVMKRLSNASGLFAETMDTANTAWKENTALTKEAKTFYATTENQVKMLKNTFSNMGVQIYKNMNEPIKEGTKTLQNFAKSKAGEEAMEDIGTAAGKMATETLKAIKYIITNFDVLTKRAGIVGKTIAEIFIVNKIGTFVKSIIGVITQLQGWFIANKQLIASQGLLNAAMNANPIGLVITAISTLIGIIGVYKFATAGAKEKTDSLTEAQGKGVEKAREMKKAYDEMDNTRKKSFEAINAEYDHLASLKNELNGLIDANGQVKEGDEDRANFIINELSNALGIEKEQIWAIINSNGKLGESIDQVITKKRAEAALIANEEMYTEAIQNKDEALKIYQKNMETLDATEKEYNKTKDEAARVLENYNTLVANGSEGAETYFQANKSIIEENNKAKEAFEKAGKAVKDSEDTYTGYVATIQNNEGLSAAVISNDSAKIIQELTNLENNFITAENGTKRTLENQVKNMQDHYNSLQKAMEAGTPGVSQEMVDSAKAMVDSASNELGKLETVGKESGEKGANAVTQGIEQGIPKGELTASEYGRRFIAAINNKNFNIAGWQVGQDFGKGIEISKEEVDNKAKTISDSTNEKLGSADTGATGGQQADKFNLSLGNKKGEIDTTAFGISSSANMNLGAANTEETGYEKGNNFNSGLNGVNKSVGATGRNLSYEANQGLGNADTRSTGGQKGNEYNSGLGSIDTYQTGRGRAAEAKNGLGSVDAEKTGYNFTSGFSNGMGSFNLRDVAYDIGKSALDAIKSALGIHSPSREAYKVGDFFISGFVNAIGDGTKNVVKEVKMMAKSAVTELNRGMEGGSFTINAKAGKMILSQNTGQSSAERALAYGGNTHQKVVNNNYYYTQNNTSPKPLSRLDIYRQTQNQLNFMRT